MYVQPSSFKSGAYRVSTWIEDARLPKIDTPEVDDANKTEASNST